MLMLTSTSGRNVRAPTNELVIPIMAQNASRSSRNSARMNRTMITAMPAFSRSNVRRS